MTNHAGSNLSDQSGSQEDPLGFLRNISSLEELKTSVGEFTPGEQIAVELAQFVISLPDDQKARFDRMCPSLVERILDASALPREETLVD